MYKIAERSYLPEVVKECDCVYHRYNNVYLCSCGKLVSCSQGDWNEHKTHPNGIVIPSGYFYHEDTAKTFFDRLHAFGLLPYFQDGFNSVYSVITEMK
jgi:hypothetical protein